LQTERGLSLAKNSVVSAARKIAFDTLLRVEAEGAYASDVLHTELGANVKTEDAALATELTLGVLRWRGLLDFHLEHLLKKTVSRLDLAVALALRMGLYQLRFLERIPASAAVNESVDLVKRARKSSASSLVNAVLRKAANESHNPPERFLAPNLPPAQRLSILYSHPIWMIERWLSSYGAPRTVTLLQAHNRAPRLSIALHDVDRREEVVRELNGAGFRVDDGRLLATAFALSGGHIARSEAFRTGRISIQDEASQAIPLLLDVHAGDRVLDLCAAPGGKTTSLARAAGRGLVVATDRHAHRLRAMRAQLKRLGLNNVLLAELDATKGLPFGTKFNRILVDAPCSGTGTLARHPEIRWRLRPEQIGEFHQLQLAILENALANLAPGGRLIYSTCSLEREENEEVITEALGKNRSVQRVPSGGSIQNLQRHLAPGAEANVLLDESGQFHTLPGEQQTDGFFAAIVEKL
jgi:16S rRNA (cytosine967-C5)-methyltransferase